jgi:hypothetical protein
MSTNIEKGTYDPAELSQKRNLLQVFLMEEMGAKHKDEEARKFQKELAEKFGALFSKIIDTSKDNDTIKTLFMSGDYKEASLIVLEDLKLEPELQNEENAAYLQKVIETLEKLKFELRSNRN